MDLPVTRTFVPPWEEFEGFARQAFQAGQLTNHGPLVERLELALAAHLKAREVVCVANGTLAIWAALTAAYVRPGDEVLVPGFTYVATAAAVRLCGAVPVLVDINPVTLCMDPALAEKAVTDLTTAVLPVDVYGSLADRAAFDALSVEHGIPVVYDAAHSFASGAAVWGQASALSFHATKLFHTCEGGAVATDDADLARRVRRLRNFGHVGANSFEGFGINAKMSELHAAVGLSVLPHVPEILEARRKVVQAYDVAFVGAAAMGPVKNDLRAYYPYLFRTELERERIQGALWDEGIHARRYFSPALSALSWCRKRGELSVAEDVSRRILCLPLSHAMTPDDARRVAAIVIEATR